MTEFTDEEVMSPAPTAGREMSDAEVMAPVTDLFNADGVRDIVKANPRGYFGRIVDAFKSGADEGYAPQVQFGYTDENKKWLTTTRSEMFNAFADSVLIPAVAHLDLLYRTPNSIYHALGDAMIAAGIPRDIPAMPEAFMGSPRPTGMFATRLEKPVGAVREAAPSVEAQVMEARDLGVIGPQRPPIAEGTPAQAAEAVTRPRYAAADVPPDAANVVKIPEITNQWQERFNGFVEKLKTPDDVKQLIKDAASENGEFLSAREGAVPLAHVESLAQAAGVAAETVDARGIGRLMRNDAEVRVGMQLMLQATENVKAIARDVKLDASPDNLLKLQESMLRRDMAVEQVVGLRAEWGRTGRVFQEFLRDVRDAETLDGYLKSMGRTPEDLVDIARGLDVMDRSQAARVLSDMNKRTPGAYYWTWVQGLISGTFTHTKYVMANALYTTMENGATPAIASVIGKAKQLFGAEIDRVYFGEPAAATWGLLAGVPDAVRATAKSIYSGQRAVLRSEIEVHKEALARGENVSPIIDRAVNQLSGQMRPAVFQGSDVWGKLKGKDWAGAGVDALGRALGAPGDVAMGIHTFFKILGERAGIEAEAYRAAINEGMNASEARFWARRAEIAANPTYEMRERSIANAYKGTFMQELGPHGKAWQRFTKETPGLRWLFPFSHIPVNLVKATYEHTPFAFLDKEMRADLLGRNGGIAQDKAIARMVAGSAIMGYFVNEALNGRATGDYPLDPKERDAWKLEGKQPNSMLIGNTWVSFAKFGPAGSLANLAANIAYVIPHLTSGDDDAMTKGTFHAARAAAHVVVDEVGFLSLAMLFEALQEEKKGIAWAASTAATLTVPYSSGLSQYASYHDPYMREAQTFIDGIKNKIPFARESLLPKRDWLGNPIANPQYGNILRQRTVIDNPVNREMVRLQIHPGKPQDRIGGVKLTPAEYDRYQTLAGAFTKQMLDAQVSNPKWSEMPDVVREHAIRDTITATRQVAAAAMQAANPHLISHAVQQRVDYITGKSRTPRPKHAPQ